MCQLRSIARGSGDNSKGSDKEIFIFCIVESNEIGRKYKEGYYIFLAFHVPFRVPYSCVASQVPEPSDSVNVPMHFPETETGLTSS